jgi:hypothetical protein
MLITTENDEITLAFGYGHLHAYRFYADDLMDAVDLIRTTALAIVRCQTVSFEILADERPLGGGFSAVHDLHRIGDHVGWSDRWRRINVRGWARETDRVIERASA